MSRGKYLSLEEARKAGQLDQFAKEHPIEDVHPQAHPEAPGRCPPGIREPGTPQDLRTGRPTGTGTRDATMGGGDVEPPRRRAAFPLQGPQSQWGRFARKP